MASALLAVVRAVPAMFGGSDLRWLSRPFQQVQRRATPRRDKSLRVVHSAKLRGLGLELMKENRPGREDTLVADLVRYRDGLLIAFLAMRP